MVSAADAPLLADQRHERILAEVARTGGARVSDLVSALGVSDMTIRRDIQALAQTGRLQRVHGGALPAALPVASLAPARSADEPTLAQKTKLHPAEKAAIARAALALVVPGSTLALSAGSTTLVLAQHLADLNHAATLTILTNSLPAADVLSRTTSATVLLTGGERTPSDALVGPLADRACEGLHTDLAFLGVHGMAAETGPTTPNLREAATSARLIATARRTVVLADSSKWGVVGIRTLAPWTAVHTVITDSGLPRAARLFLTDTIKNLEIV